MRENFVRVLGSADWHQTAHNDHSCYTIDDRILVDACPSVVTSLQEHGVEPLDIRLVLMTHMHCDHYMGLAPLLHYWRVCRDKDLSGLTIAGPKADIRRLVEKTLAFVFDSGLAENVTGMPRIVELEDGGEIDFPPYHIRAGAGDHAVPDIVYRVTDSESGHAAGFTGDTRYLESFPAFFRDVDLLLHEASFGAGPVHPEQNAVCRHSSAQEAVRVCKEGGVRSLLLTHSYEPKREAAVAEVRRQLHIPAGWALPHHVYPY
ncbi:MAG: MBL fold metallo-hydrolase [Provencibacterium sp.]|jgi:ribonuclease Z|nr:MBL fold metallo-hydrolase [Provencibacterium sp.]